MNVGTYILVLAFLEFRTGSSKWPIDFELFDTLDVSEYLASGEICLGEDMLLLACYCHMSAKACRKV